jgi:hypothetical protein
LKQTGFHPSATAALTGTAVVLTAAAVVIGSGPVTAAPEPAVTGARTALHTIDLSRAPAARTSAFGAGPAATTASASAVTAPFSLVGVTWTDPAVSLTGAAQVRTRAIAGHTWSPWRALETDEPPAVDAGAEAQGTRGSTDPLWVGASDGLQVRVLGAGALPAGARVDLIDPGADPAPAAAAAEPATAVPTENPGFSAPAGRAVTLPPRPVPTLVSRAGWRADESLNRADPEYTSDVQTLFVHHTAGTNSYSCGDSAKIIRSIHAYHVRSKKWNDVGYNFLVDKCGTLFEGRAGGITRPVLGAHTKGFNAHAAGIAVLGDYAGRGISAKVEGIIAQVAAYKIGMYGNGTGGSVTMTSAGSNKYRSGTKVRMNRISGHRDAVSTECPGNTLYGRLHSIRDLADGPVAGLTVSRLTGATRVGSIFATSGDVTLTWAVRTPTALLSHFEIILDGQVVSARPNWHRSLPLRLAPGTHKVRVRAVPLAGAASLSSTWTVVADAVAPTFTAGPAVALRTGSLDGVVPVTVGWRAADDLALGSVVLSRPSVRAFGPAVTRFATTARPGVATTWTLRVTDTAGNADYGSVTRTPVVSSEASAVRTGSWGLRRSSGFLGGTALLSAQTGASLSWSFTGRSASLAFTRTATSGQARVYVDGDFAITLDLRSTPNAHRQARWAQTWPSSGSHTVTVVVAGTAGRPTVISDGLVYLD